VLREAVILSVAYEKHSTYEWARHIDSATHVGIDPAAVIDAVDRAPTGCVDAAAIIARDVAAGRMPDATAAAILVKELGPRGYVELTTLAAYYCMLAMLIEFWAVPLDSDVTTQPFPHGERR
jgi:hypothetical protein